MNRVLIGIRGVQTEAQMKRIIETLVALAGVERVDPIAFGQIEIDYDPKRLTVMDLIRTVRELGFLAGML